MTNLQIMSKAIRHMMKWGFWGGLCIGGLYGVLVGTPLALPFTAISISDYHHDPQMPTAILLGGIFGLIYGISIGLALGVANGLLIGLITRPFFHSQTNADTYTKALAAVSGLFTLIGYIVAFVLLFSVDISGLVGNPILTWIPALISSLTAMYASQRFACWYIDQKART